MYFASFGNRVAVLTHFIMSMPSDQAQATVERTSPGPFILVSLLLFLGALFLFITYLIGNSLSLNFLKSFYSSGLRSTWSTFFLGARLDTRRNRRVLEGLLGRGGGPSLQGLAGSLAEALSGDGSPFPERCEGGPSCEAPEEEESEDTPPPYDQVVGSGACVLHFGPTNIWGERAVDLDWKVDYLEFNVTDVIVDLSDTS